MMNHPRTADVLSWIKRARRTTWCWACVAALVACSGSDDGGTSTPPPASDPPPASLAPSNEELRVIAEASLAANVRKAHPHEGNAASNPGAPPTTSPSVPPGNAFTQGIPGDDIEQTAVYSIGSVTGESGGFDIFNAVNTADAEPGKGLVAAFYAGTNDRGVDAPGDRFILGDHERAYYLGRTGNVDNDFARMLQVDERGGNEIVLHGASSDYRMVETTGAERGTAVFYNHRGTYDLIGYLDLQVKTDPNDPIYKYVSVTNMPSPTPVATTQLDQFGGTGADLITAMDVDAAGNVYVTGITRSNLTGLFPAGGGIGQMFTAKYSASGQRLWLTQFGSAGQVGDLAWDIAIDASAVYIAARYIAAETLVGGLKDSAYFKLDANSGVVLREEVWGGTHVQYAGAVALDNGEFVYFSGIGFDVAQPNPDGSQDPYIEKRRRSDLSLVKRKLYGGDKDNVSGAGGAFNKEPWGGLKFFPTVGGVAGQGTVYSAGWTQGSYEGAAALGGGDVWLVAFDENLNELWAEGWGSSQRDWAWDLDVDAQGNIYIIGLTLGNMAGPSTHRGASDGFITKIDPTRAAGQRVVWTRQLGSAKSDELRKIKIVGNAIYVCGHTYGDLAAPNAGQSDLWLAKLDLDGNALHQVQIGSGQDERAMVTADANGVYVGGYTFGSLVRATAGYIDAFVMRFTQDLAAR
jgi:hypothetical protein